jgi:hypothetical protein
MAAVFSFGFVGDDVENDEAIKQRDAPISEPDIVTHTTTLPTKRHGIEELVSNKGT